MTREIISTPNAPAAIGPYSQGIKFSGTLVYTAGQLSIDPTTGELKGTTASEQTEQVLKNISAILEAAGTSLSNIVKATVFLKNMEDFAEMNKVYMKYIPNSPPARSAFEIARLPKDALVEIECLAVAP